MKEISVDLDADRQALADAIATVNTDANPRTRFRLARLLLRDRATQAIGGAEGAILADTLKLAEGRANTPDMRAFAVLLVHALGVPGLIDTGFPAIQRFLEQVLHHPLHRARYPFDGTSDSKRAVLERLHTTIEEHTHPLEPSIPTWISGNWR